MPAGTDVPLGRVLHEDLKVVGATGRYHRRMATTALITGASSGIGAACAEALADKGLHLCLTARREDRLQALCRKVNNRYGADVAFYVVGDVTDDAARRAALDEAMSRWGRLDVLVNNAGLALPGAVEDVDLDQVRHQFEVNTFASLGWMQLVGPVMREQRQGRIINMSSVSGRMSLPSLGAYAASKFALEAFSDAARVEYRPWGISVSLIEPGAIATEIWGKSHCHAEAHAPAWESSPFAPIYDIQRQHAEKLMDGDGPGPEIVARAVCHAATAKRPKTRYRMPTDARILNVFTHLPTWLRDWAVLRLYGIKPGPGRWLLR